MLRPSPNYGTLWLHNDDDDELRQENAVWLCHTAAWPWRGHNCYDNASPRQADVKSILFLILHVCQRVTVFIKRKRFYTGEILVVGCWQYISLHAHVIVISSVAIWGCGAPRLKPIYS